MQALDTLLENRNGGGHLMFLDGNGLSWRVALHQSDTGMIEIRRAESNIRAWASEVSEYYMRLMGTTAAYGEGTEARHKRLVALDSLRRVSLKAHTIAEYLPPMKLHPIGYSRTSTLRSLVTSGSVGGCGLRT